jgi:hypothetical protein
MELETAKEILAETFHARPGEIEGMIQRRLAESGPEEREEERKGRLCQMAEGQPGAEEVGPGLRAKGGTDGQEALQRGILRLMIRLRWVYSLCLYPYPLAFPESTKYYITNTEIRAPIRITQSISTLNNNATNAATAIVSCGKIHCMLDAKWKATEASSPTKEHKMPLTVLLNLVEPLSLS